MKLGIRGTLSVAQAAEHLAPVLQALREHGFEYLLAAELAGVEELPVGERCPGDKLSERVDMIMTLGGDGSILAAARELTRDIPLFGLHLGSFGYLTAAIPDTFTEMLTRLKHGEYHLEQRLRLRVQVEDDQQTLPMIALNELLVTTTDPTHLVTLETRVNDEQLFTFNGDGLLIATPTGSTAYSLASGGPVLEPTMKAMIIMPLSAHTINVRPMVIAHTSRVTVLLDNPEKKFVISADGQHDYMVRGKGRVIIEDANDPVRLVRFGVPGFLGVLREKLKWNV
ncbi:MAG: NAD(+)/NADH kinase [Candidatus Delongbacteria bacterium]|nr:NAD(+)/NADH kinase [Candidatus Delongbacteria bacterium]